MLNITLNLQLTVSVVYLSIIIQHSYAFHTSNYKIPNISSQEMKVKSVQADDILSTSEVMQGIGLGTALALSWATLQRFNRDTLVIDFEGVKDRSQDEVYFTEDSYMSFNASNSTDNSEGGVGGGGPVVFEADEWKELQRSGNYIWYNRPSFRRDDDYGDKSKSRTTLLPVINFSSFSTSQKEKKWVLIALLVLFVPLFSIEFFFALSRQFLCWDVSSSVVPPFTGGGSSQPNSISQLLCSPHE